MEKPSVPHTIRHVFDGRIFRVDVESITTPKGSALDVEVVRHPGSVVLIPLTDQNQVVLVRQYRHAIGRWVWELPAGTLKPGEPPATAAARECQEEIGLIPGELTRVGAFYPTPGYCDEEMNFYKATRLRTPGASDAHAEPDADEDIERGEFTPAEVHAMIASGEIVDLKTVAGMSLLGVRLVSVQNQPMKD